MVTLRVMVEVNEEEVEDDGGRGSKERVLEVDSDSDMVEEEVVELLEYMEEEEAVVVVEEEKVVMGEEEVAVGEEEEELMCYSYKEVVEVVASSCYI